MPPHVRGARLADAAPAKARIDPDAGGLKRTEGVGAALAGHQHAGPAVGDPLGGLQAGALGGVTPSSVIRVLRLVRLRLHDREAGSSAEPQVHHLVETGPCTVTATFMRPPWSGQICDPRRPRPQGPPRRRCWS